MSNKKSSPTGWELSISGSDERPGDNRIILARDHEGKRVLLEILASGLPIDPVALDSAVRKLLQETLADLQRAAESPPGLELRRNP